MAVFVGGCTLEAMEHVVAGTTEAIGPPAETAAALTDLADRCLLTVDHRWNVTHFGMLETVSNYAFERLRERASARSRFGIKARRTGRA